MFYNYIKENCDYCKIIYNFNKALLNDDCALGGIVKYKDGYAICDAGGEYVTFNVKYCPCCGRKL